MLRVILAEDEPIIRMDIRRLLEELGHEVVGECRDGSSAVILTRKYQPDLVVMDIKMPGTDGLVATRAIAEGMLAPVVLLTSYSDSETVQEAIESGALGYLVKPVDKSKLVPTLKVARQRFLEMRKLSTEVDSLAIVLEDRLVITRAKVALQKKLGCTEEEAFKILRKMSMDKQRKVADMAKCIIIKETGNKNI